MEVPTRRETAAFVLGYVVVLVTIGALIATARGRDVVPHLAEEFTDLRFLFVATFGVVLWAMVYPRAAATPITGSVRPSEATAAGTGP